MGVSVRPPTAWHRFAVSLLPTLFVEWQPFIQKGNTKQDRFALAQAFRNESFIAKQRYAREKILMKFLASGTDKDLPA